LGTIVADQEPARKGMAMAIYIVRTDPHDTGKVTVLERLIFKKGRENAVFDVVVGWQNFRSGNKI
jgi:hypothetical protein